MGHGEFNGAVSELWGIAFDDSNMSSSANPVWSVNDANDDEFVRWGGDDAIPDGETLYVAPHYTIPDGQVLFVTDAYTFGCMPRFITPPEAKPPSTPKMWPLTYDASSLARKTAAAATSCVVP